MSNKNNQYAYFALWGDFDPDEVSARIGIAPTVTWRVGDPIRNGRVHEESRWKLQSRLDNTEDLEAHIRDVLAQMDSRSEQFTDLCVRFTGCMQLVGYFWAGYPGLTFDAELVRHLAHYNLSVDFDFYGFDRPDEDDG